MRDGRRLPQDLAAEARAIGDIIAQVRAVQRAEGRLSLRPDEAVTLLEAARRVHALDAAFLAQGIDPRQGVEHLPDLETCILRLVAGPGGGLH